MTDVRLHPHAIGRLDERGTNAVEVIATVQGGESFPAKVGRTGFRRNFVLTVSGEAGTMRQSKSRHSRSKKMDGS